MGGQIKYPVAHIFMMFNLFKKVIHRQLDSFPLNKLAMIMISPTINNR